VIGGKKEYIEMFGSITEPSNSDFVQRLKWLLFTALYKLTILHYFTLDYRPTACHSSRYEVNKVTVTSLA